MSAVISSQLNMENFNECHINLLSSSILAMKLMVYITEFVLVIVDEVTLTV